MTKAEEVLVALRNVTFTCYCGEEFIDAEPRDYTFNTLFCPVCVRGWRPRWTPGCKESYWFVAVNGLEGDYDPS